MNIEQTVIGICRDACAAARGVAMAPAGRKNAALEHAAKRLREREADLLAANRETSRPVAATG